MANKTQTAANQMGFADPSAAATSYAKLTPDLSTRSNATDASPSFGTAGYDGGGNAPFNTNAVYIDRGAAFGGPGFGPSFNIQQGGQLGFHNRSVSMDGATPLPLHCAHVFVLQMPRFWDRFPATQRAYKAMIELNATTIDGIDMNYTMDFGDVEIGHDGQMASMPLLTKRAAVNPSVALNEVGGNIFWNLNYTWLKHISHPDTTASLLASLYGDNLEQWVWSTFSATWLVVQPDPTGLYNRIVDAHVITNIIPDATGPFGIKRQIGAAEVAKRTVNYKGVWTHNEHTRELGRLVMKAINAHRPNLDYALTWDGVKANISDKGHQRFMGRSKQDGLMSVLGENSPIQLVNNYLSSDEGIEAVNETIASVQSPENGYILSGHATAPVTVEATTQDN